MANRPFEKDERLSGSSLETLRNWLAENVPAAHLITPEYSVDDLVADLNNMLDGMWNDGIDAMGEDA